MWIALVGFVRPRNRFTFLSDHSSHTYSVCFSRARGKRARRFELLLQHWQCYVLTIKHNARIRGFHHKRHPQPQPYFDAPELQEALTTSELHDAPPKPAKQRTAIKLTKTTNLFIVPPCSDDKIWFPPDSNQHRDVLQTSALPLELENQEPR